MPEYNLPANYGTFVLVFDIYATSSSASTNTSTVYYNAYLKKTGGSTSVQPFNGNPSRIKVWLDSGDAEPNRHNHTVTYDFRYPNNAIGATVGLGASGTVDFTHNTNGARSVTWRARFEGNGGSPLGTADSGYQTLTLSDFDRSALRAGQPSVSRSSNGQILYYSVTDPGANNSGPQRDFDWQYRAEGGGYAGLGATGDPSGNVTVGSAGQHVTYYVRVLAYNSDGSNGWSVDSVASHGIPNSPSNPSATRSSSVNQRIDLSWGNPSYIGGSISRYNIYKKPATQANFPSIPTATSTTTSYADSTGLERGVTYDYLIRAVNATGEGTASATISAMAPGVPSAPGVPTVSSKVGRTLTINSQRTSINYGNNITEYRIQLSTDGGATWRGWDNAAKTFTNPGTYNTLDASGNITYTLLSPALTYLWRSYAVNSIGSGDFATTQSGTFVSSGGKRWNGTEWSPTETAKRWDGSAWTDITIAKRWNGSAWVDLT